MLISFPIKAYTLPETLVKLSAHRLILSNSRGFEPGQRGSFFLKNFGYDMKSTFLCIAIVNQLKRIHLCLALQKELRKSSSTN